MDDRARINSAVLLYLRDICKVQWGGDGCRLISEGTHQGNMPSGAAGISQLARTCLARVADDRERPVKRLVDGHYQEVFREDVNLVVGSKRQSWISSEQPSRIPL